MGKRDSYIEIGSILNKGVLRKGIEKIRVFGEGRIEVVWKAGDMFSLKS